MKEKADDGGNRAADCLNGGVGSVVRVIERESIKRNGKKDGKPYNGAVLKSVS